MVCVHSVRSTEYVVKILCFFLQRARGRVVIYMLWDLKKFWVLPHIVPWDMEKFQSSPLLKGQEWRIERSEVRSRHICSGTWKNSEFVLYRELVDELSFWLFYRIRSQNSVLLSTESSWASRHIYALGLEKILSPSSYSSMGHGKISIFSSIERPRVKNRTKRGAESSYMLWDLEKFRVRLLQRAGRRVVI